VEERPNESAVNSDEHEVIALIVAFSWLTFLPFAYGLNRLILRKSAMRARRYWPIVSFLLTVPYFVACLLIGAVMW
jgi:cobalamin synthase